MRTTFPALTLLFLASCTSYTPLEGTLYGDDLELREITPIAAILEAPDDFVGKRVQVEGMVEEVCEKLGCWMDIVAAGENEKIQVKVEDGVIVFPISARGRTARAEGFVEKLERSEEEARAAAEHRAEEQGENFDPSTVTGSEVTYRIKGTGAIVTNL